VGLAPHRSRLLAHEPAPADLTVLLAVMARCGRRSLALGPILSFTWVAFRFFSTQARQLLFFRQPGIWSGS